MDRGVNSEGQLYDVVIVGAGIVGTALAWKLSSEGYRVCVCERSEAAAPSLRLEPLSHEALGLLREMGLWEHLRPALMPLDSVAHFRNGYLVKGMGGGSYVAAYDQLVASLRPRLAKVATVIWDRVVQVSAHGRIKSVRLESGQVVCSWMVVLATGAATGEEPEPLEGPVETICEDYCRLFACDLAFEEPERLMHAALVFQTSHASHGYHSLKLFDLGGGRVRANFLTYWGATDKRRQELLRGNGAAVLGRTVEGLLPCVGAFDLLSPIEENVVHLNQPGTPGDHGFVLAGDACGPAAPSGALGLHKGLHDVRVLAELMPRWEREARGGTADFSDYYAHPAKQAIDAEVLERSLRERKMAIDWHPSWATRRLIGDRFPGWVETALAGPSSRNGARPGQTSRSGLDN
jgi:2-polyprenyl-6-methoxyphenol hydroxylase-like FAD-dependent oxidoreductase